MQREWQIESTFELSIYAAKKAGLLTLNEGDQTATGSYRQMRALASYLRWEYISINGYNPIRVEREGETLAYVLVPHFGMPKQVLCTLSPVVSRKQAYQDFMTAINERECMRAGQLKKGEYLKIKGTYFMARVDHVRRSGLNKGVVLTKLAVDCQPGEEMWVGLDLHCVRMTMREVLTMNNLRRVAIGLPKRSYLPS